MMNQPFYRLFIALILCGAVLKSAVAYPSSQEAWNTLYPAVEKRIVPPTFKDKKYNITDFGAKSGKPDFLNTKAINGAIDQCSSQGGGTVIIPVGVWHTGPITLKSNVNLHLSEGATLLFTSDLNQYPLVLTRWEGMDCYNYQPMIYAYDQVNIAVTGKGTVDGGASRDNWWSMNGSPRYGWKEGIVSQKIGRPLLQKWNEEEKPVEERRMGNGFGMRTQLVNLYKCRNVLVEGIKLLRSPFWVLHPLMCENITVRRLHIENDGPNGDGCDPESCKDVLIENCYFDTGDDCIAIKSGRNNDGRRWNIPAENIIVRNCRMKNGHGGVVVGSEISGGYRNLFVDNCEMDSPELERVIRIKTNNCRGGTIENIFVRNITVGQCKEAVLKINTVYEAREACNRSFPPAVRNVYLENITCRKSRYGVMITALDDEVGVHHIHVNNCSFTGVESEGCYISGKTSDIHFGNLYINNQLFTEHQPLSETVLFSEIKRNPESWMLDFSRKPKWSYTLGVELEAFLDVYNRYGNESVLKYILSYTDQIVNADGSINTYTLAHYNIDQINTGKLLFRIYDLTKEEKYLKALRMLHTQLEGQPRTSEGGFWHKNIYPHQMWLDGIYMGSPFLAQYGQRFSDNRQAVYDDVTRQFTLITRHTFDPVTGLFRHAWDESKSQAWADPATGQSAHAWGRAQGWFFMALIDVLDYIPDNNPKRSELLTILHTVADGVLKTQDTATGLWYQVMDMPDRKGNYLEATCSSMFCYSLLKGVRKGYFGEKHHNAAQKAHKGICNHLLKTNTDGTVSLTQCCEVAGLGGTSRRNGTFEYYISEPVRDNDPKGIGPFIKACLEMEMAGQ